MPSERELNSIASTHAPSNPAGKCRKAVDEVSLELGRAGIDHEVIEGRFTAWRLDTGEGEAYHWYIRVSDNMIVDPTIHQFTHENYLENGVDAYIDETQFPDGYVVTSSDSVFRAYE